MAAHVTSSLELWRAYRRSKDPALRERLVEADLALVKSLAARIASRLPKHLRFDDLFSAGLLGFLATVDEFDPERGVGFSSYASIVYAGRSSTSSAASTGFPAGRASGCAMPGEPSTR
jgi:DNA-directed RNA polymerase specialized sigma subunit